MTLDIILILSAVRLLVQPVPLRPAHDGDDGLEPHRVSQGRGLLKEKKTKRTRKQQ